MKIPPHFPTAILIALTAATSAQGEVAVMPNPLDFPGQGPVGPTPGGPGGFPLFPVVPPPVINPPEPMGPNQSINGPFAWTGDAMGSIFTAASWKNSSEMTPYNLTVASPLNYDLSASNVQFDNADQQLNLGSGSLTLTDVIINFVNGATPTTGGILGDTSGAPSLVSLRGGSFIFADYLQNLQIVESQDSGPYIQLFASRSSHNDGTAFSGSTIDLTQGSFVLIYKDATALNPVTTAEVLSAYFPAITFDGSGAVLGLDPLVAEPGDNLLMLPVTSSTDGGATTFTGGWGFAPIPEPSALLLAALATPLALRRKRRS